MGSHGTALVDRNPPSDPRTSSEEMGAQEMIDSFTNWMASVNESRWHLIEHEGGSPVALCTHRVRGPVRRVISVQPPNMDDGRTICPNCHNLGIERRRLCEDSTKRRWSLAAALAAIEDTITWPEVDQDRQKEVPGSPYLPGTAPELTAAA